VSSGIQLAFVDTERCRTVTWLDSVAGTENVPIDLYTELWSKSVQERRRRHGVRGADGAAVQFGRRDDDE
jgi:hypothetical protein